MDADQLLKSLPQPIAVIGNGMMRRRHDEIEAHATIIRMNDFAQGWDGDVGHRVDVWCVTTCGTVQFREFDRPVQVMTVETMEEGQQIAAWLERYPDMAIPAQSWFEEATKLRGSGPTSGLVLLVRMMHHNLRFTAFGFDGLRSGHYWDVNHQHAKLHGDELSALMELAKRGAVFA